MTEERLSAFRPGWVIHLAPAVLSIVAAFTLGSMHPSELPKPMFSWEDKFGHFFAFALVQATHVRAAEFLAEPRWHRGLIWRAFLSASLFGGLLEVWQGFLPFRSAEFLDFVADSAGALAATLVYLKVRGNQGPGAA